MIHLLLAALFIAWAPAFSCRRRIIVVEIEVPLLGVWWVPVIVVGVAGAFTLGIALSLLVDWIVK